MTTTANKEFAIAHPTVNVATKDVAAAPLATENQNAADLLTGLLLELQATSASKVQRAWKELDTSAPAIAAALAEGAREISAEGRTLRADLKRIATSPYVQQAATQLAIGSSTDAKGDGIEPDFSLALFVAESRALLGMKTSQTQHAGRHAVRVACPGELSITLAR